MSSATAIENRQRGPTRKEFAFISLIVFILLPLLGTVFGWVFRVHNLHAVDDLMPRTAFLMFDVHLVNIDAVAETMAFVWSVQCSNSPASQCASSNVSIFFDTNLIVQSDDSDAKASSNSIPDTPIFVWDPTLVGNTFANSPTFKTTVSMFASQKPNQLALQYYPFDQYRAQIFLFANDDSNNAIPLKIVTSSGVEAGFSATIDRSSTQTSSEGFLDMIISVRRAKIVKAYCISIIALIWFITLSLCFAVMFIMLRGVYMDMQLLLVPVATIFSFTQLRGVLPGIPSNGTIIDYVALLPCFMYVTLTAFLMLVQAVFFPDGWRVRWNKYRGLSDNNTTSCMNINKVETGSVDTQSQSLLGVDHY
ncbi:hypothetical protein HGRIS_013923 [Hohenbuehelia grisea]|uniref:Transmembrane protein n=1 Tax=Hohenbuehelia grisea TaxID=104357 RepID=A0ABR3JST1_9AGAR